MEEDLQVFGYWESPYSRRVELALKLKGLSYKYFEEDLPFNKSDLLLKFNPVYKKVPVLVHNGKPISESVVILEYIEENWYSNHDYPLLFPQDPHQRALARFWAQFIDQKVVSAVVKAAGSKGEEEREEAVKEAEETLKPLEKELQNNKKKFFGGDEIGFVDIVGILIAHWIPAIEECFEFELLTATKFPNLIKWTEELTNHCVVKQVLSPRNEIVAFMQANWKF